MQKSPLFSEVILTKDFPQYQFRRGQVATVIEFIEPSGYILEVFDNQGDTKIVIAVSESDITFLKSSILSDSEREYHEKVIAKGGKTIENFEEFMQDFQKSCQDRELERFDVQLKKELEKVIKEKGYTEDDFRQMLSA
jgi:predicted nucleic acid-binding OB-fold protein